MLILLSLWFKPAEVRVGYRVSMSWLYFYGANATLQKTVSSAIHPQPLRTRYLEVLQLLCLFFAIHRHQNRITPVTWCTHPDSLETTAPYKYFTYLLTKSPRSGVNEKCVVTNCHTFKFGRLLLGAYVPRQFGKGQMTWRRRTPYLQKY